MRKTLTILLILFNFIVTGQSWSEIDSIFKEISVKKVVNDTPIEKFTQFFYEEDTTNDTLRFCNENLNIFYLRYNNYGLLIHNDKIYKLKYYNNNVFIPLEIDPYSSDIYKFNYKKDTFLCIISGGTGILQSGSFQEIGFFTLINKSRKTVSTFQSRFRSIYSFGDFNKDGKLDFLVVRNNPKQLNSYIVTPHTIIGNKLYPIKNGDKQYYINIMKTEKGFIVKEKKWFS